LSGSPDPHLAIAGTRSILAPAVHARPYLTSPNRPANLFSMTTVTVIASTQTSLCKMWLVKRAYFMEPVELQVKSK